MTIENTAIILAIGLVFNYVVLYKRNKFFGNMLYLLMSALMLYHGSTLTPIGDKNITIAIGAIMIIGSIINAIYDILFDNKDTIHKKIGR
jgi:hypothetical protein